MGVWKFEELGFAEAAFSTRGISHGSPKGLLCNLPMVPHRDSSSHKAGSLKPDVKSREQVTRPYSHLHLKEHQPAPPPPPTHRQQHHPHHRHHRDHQYHRHQHNHARTRGAAIRAPTSLTSIVLGPELRGNYLGLRFPSGTLFVLVFEASLVKAEW